MTVPDYRDPRLTEQRNPRTERIDVASTLEIVDLLNAEDATVAGAVRAVRAEPARAIDLVVNAVGRGGRVICVGAGAPRFPRDPRPGPPRRPPPAPLPQPRPRRKRLPRRRGAVPAHARSRLGERVGGGGGRGYGGGATTARAGGGRCGPARRAPPAPLPRHRSRGKRVGPGGEAHLRGCRHFRAAGRARRE